MTIEQAKERVFALTPDLHNVDDIQALGTLVETASGLGDLEERHWQECQQIAHYDAELTEKTELIARLKDTIVSQNKLIAKLFELGERHE